jgi:pyruvate/2-oxoglutarate dehydrogenase complex dihydrolipoamide dehydrogenase (E3) component
MQNVGVELDGKVVKVDKYLRTNVPHIWALGDVIGRIELTPVALMEGMTFAANCFGKDGLKEPDYGSVPSAVRSSPLCITKAVWAVSSIRMSPCVPDTTVSGVVSVCLQSL